VKTTCLGTALASCAGMSFTLEKTFNWLITVPDKTLTKKTFQIVKYKTLQHALFFLPLREIDPSTAENSIMAGGTVYKAKIKITLGR
jgi:hypothetical protein